MPRAFPTGCCFGILYYSREIRAVHSQFNWKPSLSGSPNKSLPLADTYRRGPPSLTLSSMFYRAFPPAPPPPDPCARDVASLPRLPPHPASAVRCKCPYTISMLVSSMERSRSLFSSPIRSRPSTLSMYSVVFLLYMLVSYRIASSGIADGGVGSATSPSNLRGLYCAIGSSNSPTF